MHLADHHGELSVTNRPGTRQPTVAGVEPGAGHLEDPAQPLDAELSAMLETNRKRLTGSSPWRIGGCLAQDLAFGPQLGHLSAHPAQFVALGFAHRGRIRGPGPAATFIADPVAQRLVMHTQLAGDIGHRPIRAQDQLGRLTAKLQRVLRRSPQRELLPANRDSGSPSGAHQTGARPHEECSGSVAAEWPRAMRDGRPVVLRCDCAAPLPR
jgi:hypothetical protein